MKEGREEGREGGKRRREGGIKEWIKEEREGG